MKKSKEELQTTIQELLECIRNKKEELDILVKQYQELSKIYIPVLYKKKNFLDKIFKRKYKNYYKNYIYSKEIESNISEVSAQIEILHSEIARFEIALYKLENKLSELTCTETAKDTITLDKQTDNLDKVINTKNIKTNNTQDDISL